MQQSNKFASSVLFACVVLCLITRAEPAQAEDQKPDAKEAAAIGVEAYVYGYPLVTMEMQRRVMTNVATVEGLRGPMGQFAHAREYPTAAYRDVPGANVDTLYSTAWIDLTKEPYVLSLPDVGDRYFLMPMLDGWSDVFEVPGKRTTGTDAQKYAITGPGWKGDLPKGVKELKSPTNLVWIIGRTYCIGTPDDFKAVHAIQDEYKLVPLSSYGKPYTPSKGKVDPTIDMKTPVGEQVNKMDAATFFKLLASLMKDNPPQKADTPMVEKMAKIGIVPGKDFDLGKFDADTAKALQGVPKAAQERIMGYGRTAGKDVNGWQIIMDMGFYGADYIRRAYANTLPGWNRPEDAVYPHSLADEDGKPYDGANKYVLHFPKGNLPPVKGFWSLTMYDRDSFLAANPLNRYSLSPRNDLKFNDDGSLDLYIQKDSPGKEKEANWLPAPDGKFSLALRLYWPRKDKPSILDGSWEPPAVKVAN